MSGTMAEGGGGGDEVQSLLQKFAQESNQILAVCRARGELNLVKRQLAALLEVVKRIIAAVGFENNVEDVKNAAVELKNAVFKLFEVCPSTFGVAPDGIDYDEQVLRCVMELTASIKYYLSSSSFERSDSVASQHLLSRAGRDSGFTSSRTFSEPSSFVDTAPSSPVRQSPPEISKPPLPPAAVAVAASTSSPPSQAEPLGDAETMKRDLESFVKKCTALVVYSKGTNLLASEVLARFFDIMESVRNICSPRGIRSLEVKEASEKFVLFAKKTLASEMFDPSNTQELCQLVLALASSVKTSVNDHASKNARASLISTFQNAQKITLEAQSHLLEQTSEHPSTEASPRTPLAFATDIPKVDLKRRSRYASSEDDVPLHLPANISNSQGVTPRKGILDTQFVLEKPKNRDSEDFNYETEDALSQEFEDNFSLLRKKGINTNTFSLDSNPLPSLEEELPTPIQTPSQPSTPKAHEGSKSALQSPLEPEQAKQAAKSLPSPSSNPLKISQPTQDNRVLSPTSPTSPPEDLDEGPLAIFFTPLTFDPEDPQGPVIQIFLATPAKNNIPQSMSLDTLKKKMFKLKASGSEESLINKPDSPRAGTSISQGNFSGGAPPSLSKPASKAFSPPQLLSTASKSLMYIKNEIKNEINQININPASSPAPTVPEPPPVQSEPVPVYENGELVCITKEVDGKVRLEAATIKVLIENLANQEAQDHDFMRIFLLTFRHVLKPIELIELLLQRVKISFPPNPTPDQIAYFDKWAWKIQYRVVNFLKKWMESCWFDFHNEPQMLSALEKFITVVKESPKIMKLAPQIEATAKKLTEAAINEEKKAAEKRKKDQIQTISSTTNFLSLNVLSVARQLTLIEFELFKKVQPQELMIFLWGDPREKKETDLTENLTNYVNHFNKISFWVGTEICTVPGIKRRMMILEKFIQILKNLKELNNFNTLMAIVSGLNHSSVQRLKKTWEGISGRSLAILQDIERIMNPAGNYSPYREIESRKYPYFIPFFGLAMKDLIFSNDGNPKRLENGLFNISKLRLLGESVQRIMIFQSNPYEIELDQEHYEYCTKLVYIQDEARLYKYSLLCEPRASGENESPLRLVHKWQNESSEKFGFLESIERWTKDL